MGKNKSFLCFWNKIYHIKFLQNEGKDLVLLAFYSTKT